jgi:hypothetical protein
MKLLRIGWHRVVRIHPVFRDLAITAVLKGIEQKKTPPCPWVLPYGCLQRHSAMSRNRLKRAKLLPPGYGMDEVPLGAPSWPLEFSGVARVLCIRGIQTRSRSGSGERTLDNEVFQKVFGDCQ